MDKPLNDIYQVLQKLVGLHRQLLDTVRMEREALVQAELKAIQSATIAKQGLIEAIRHAEGERMQLIANLAQAWKRPMRALTLPQLIIEVQGRDIKTAELFRSTFNTLTLLIQRITEQNDDNRAFLEKSLMHVEAMKKNVLGESVPKSNTYTPKGQRSGPSNGARLISKEA